MSNHRHLYNGAAWKRLRALQLGREPLCRMCRELGQYVEATVVDHVIAHRGNEQLFFDGDNLQSLCKPCHDGHKQAQEHQRDGLVRGAGHAGQPLDRAHPWHTAGRGLVGGGQKSAAGEPKTGPSSVFAGCHNSEGGASA